MREATPVVQRSPDLLTTVDDFGTLTFSHLDLGDITVPDVADPKDHGTVRHRLPRPRRQHRLSVGNRTGRILRPQLTHLLDAVPSSCSEMVSGAGAESNAGYERRSSYRLGEQPTAEG